jgi:hypothetical protein
MKTSALAVDAASGKRTISARATIILPSKCLGSASGRPKMVSSGLGEFPLIFVQGMIFFGVCQLFEVALLRQDHKRLSRAMLARPAQGR